jgi:hypothetical protein
MASALHAIASAMKIAQGAKSGPIHELSGSSRSVVSANACAVLQHTMTASAQKHTKARTRRVREAGAANVDA